MDYKNETCLVCGRNFEDGDDIVVCPECGTPHHRACWLIDNRCACEELHGTGYEWKKKDDDTVIEAPDITDSTENSQESEQGNTVPPFSMPFSPVQDMQNNNLEALCMRGVPASKDEKIDGVRVGDMALYIQQNARHYIKKFIKGKKVSFNWAALLFSPAWFFYRKLYKAGAVILALFVAISLFTVPLSNSILDIEEKIAETIETDSESISYTDLQEAMMKPENIGKSKDFAKKGAILLAVNVIPRFIVAFCANEIYRRKMKNDIEAVDEASEDKTTRTVLLMQKGGVALFIGAIVFITADYIVPMLMSAGDFFSDIF